jgi:pSer/pThr/pTyr-binding forkhead associated (FHA) protein
MLETVDYHNLICVFNSRVVEDTRSVDSFDPCCLQSFVLKVKGSKRSRDIKFSRKQSIFTIGRDKSNNLVIEDSRVSRSHARVEYNNIQCEYIDLGSSCGSKLNGKPVLRAKLRSGDVIELGQSTLIFQVKRKKRFSLFST